MNCSELAKKISHLLLAEDECDAESDQSESDTDSTDEMCMKSRGKRRKASGREKGCFILGGADQRASTYLVCKIVGESCLPCPSVMQWIRQMLPASSGVATYQGVRPAPSFWFPPDIVDSS